MHLPDPCNRVLPLKNRGIQAIPCGTELFEFFNPLLIKFKTGILAVHARLPVLEAHSGVLQSGRVRTGMAFP